MASGKNKPAKDLLETARRVLGLEIEGLRALEKGLDGRFIDTLDLLSAMQGRAVITGMGKSGHVANKIAATFASTGTPAMFVHPAEASHGDLGMITEEDVIIALSNSGETSELADLVAYAKRFKIPLVGITGRGDSTLAKAATVALVLPENTEACPMGLAPTTSTTVMLALGDALAVAMLERKGFSPDDFHVLHPGGKLGQKLLKVTDIMHSGAELPLVAANMKMSEALVEMTTKSFGCLGVIDDDGALLGIITDGDLRRNMSPDLIQRTTADVMTAGVRTIGVEALATEALGQMNASAITTLFVAEDGRPVGIVHIHDCLRAGVA
ncbi:MAG: KpsF/GutQ family sugar-phosphate isomerase [Rhodospirillaceae bacterium]|nr:KpsF/GutQ family sugar-phosphate isomerase [Rhodospirillaceae bacterium]